MRLRLSTLAGVVAFLALSGAAPSAAPDPLSCTGYPEPRIFLENQSWWEPQSGPPTHPGTGKQGHIHVATCFPLYQRLSGDTLHLDVNVKLHNLPSTPSRLRLSAYQTNTWEAPVVVPACANVDCEHWYSLDFPISQIPYRGWRQFGLYLNVTAHDGAVQRNWTRYYAFIKRPEKPSAPAGSAGSVREHPGGDTWYSPIVGGTTGKYARAGILRAGVPWSKASGQLTPVAGIWKPTVLFEANKNFVYIDPHLHAVPPHHGTVVYEATTSNTGYHKERLAIDTTRLANGEHRLLIGTGNVGQNGTHTGVLVVPFLVNN